MNAVCEVTTRRAQKKTRIESVVRVAEGNRYVGDILLDVEGRVWRHADTIPSDVVLKTLVAIRRQGHTCGQLVSRSDGRAYLWFILAGEAEAEVRLES